MLEGLAPGARRVEGDLQVLLHLGLAAELREAARPEGDGDFLVLGPSSGPHDPLSRAVGGASSGVFVCHSREYIPPAFGSALSHSARHRDQKAMQPMWSAVRLGVYGRCGQGCSKGSEGGTEMAEWLEVGLTTGLLLFVFVGYFVSAESAWRDLRSMVTDVLRKRARSSAAVPDAPPVEPEAGVAGG